MELEEVLVKAQSAPASGGVPQEFFARDERRAWKLVAESLLPPGHFPTNANQFFNSRVSEHRDLANTAFTQGAIAMESPDESAVVLEGRIRGSCQDNVPPPFWCRNNPEAVSVTSASRRAASKLNRRVRLPGECESTPIQNARPKSGVAIFKRAGKNWLASRLGGILGT